MGEVHLAEDACLERKIALKILPKSVAQDEEMKLAWYPGWYDFGTIYIQNRSTLFDYFQLEIWAKFKFYAGFIEFCAKHKIVNSAFAMQRSGVRPSSTLPFVINDLQFFLFSLSRASGRILAGFSKSPTASRIISVPR